jgi:Ca2+-transporting ATPase
MFVILITAFANSAIGFVQEYKANKALEKLHTMVEHHAVVLRDGKKVLLNTRYIVPGDIMFLEGGDKISADGRILHAFNLQVNEAALTGESKEIYKKGSEIAKLASLPDRVNMVYRGTVVSNGRADILVTATGANTEIGKIALLVKKTDEEKTPLQIQLASLSKYIGIVIICIALIIVAIGFIDPASSESNILKMFQLAVAVAVAAIPEGLSISLTVILTVGMRIILKKNALVRKLISAETLGSVSIICVDKTGTITEGNMKVTKIVTAKDDLDEDEIKLLNSKKQEKHTSALLALKIGVLCNDVSLTRHEKGKDVYVGDTTEIALLKTGTQAGFNKKSLDDVFSRLSEVQFDSRKKYMATLHKINHSKIIYVKGAPEVVFPKCRFYENESVISEITADFRKFITEKEHECAKKGLRMLILAYKETNFDRIEEKDIEKLVFAGMVGIADPIRSNVVETLTKTKKAGIKTVMITGDHIRTASAVACAIGLECDKHQILEGKDIDELSDKELQNKIMDISVYARVEPKHKIRIVKAFQEAGHVVAMTGDGVNDAPALKGADIGIALGSGTDVAKETSDMVLIDDSFATIVSSIEEGRTIYQNISKVILYLLAGSFSEVLIVIGSIVAGFPLAILPVQILWVNIVQDLFPNIALAFDKGEKENMSEPPRLKSDPIIDKRMKFMIIVKSIMSNVVLFSIFLYFLKTTENIELTRTVVFVGFGIDALFFIFSVRSFRYAFWKRPIFDNKYLLGAIVFGWAMLIGSIYIKPIQSLLRTVPLGFEQWIVLLVYGLLNILIIEIIKQVFTSKRITI